SPRGSRSLGESHNSHCLSFCRSVKTASSPGAVIENTAAFRMAEDPRHPRNSTPAWNGTQGTDPKDRPKVTFLDGLTGGFSLLSVSLAWLTAFYFPEGLVHGQSRTRMPRIRIPGSLDSPLKLDQRTMSNRSLIPGHSCL